MSSIDRTACAGLGLRVLGADALDRVCGGKKGTKTPKATVRVFDDLVRDAVVTTDELASLHDMT